MLIDPRTKALKILKRISSKTIRGLADVVIICICIHLVRSMKISKVLKSHESEITKSLVVKKGEQLEGQEKETKWDGWLWCRTKAGVDGWVPKSYLEPLSEPRQYQLLQDYTSKELRVQPGDEVLVLIEESGWAWARSPMGEEGWVPLENLGDVKAQPESVPDLTK